MATYLQGITDYIPQLQPFQPDYNFLANVLQTKQTRYDAAHKQLSSLYGTMLNSAMLRDENIEKRNEFFRSIDENIKRLSGVDLSLQQNVDQASEMFKGLYEDKDIVKDMTWTKNWMNQREKGKLLKTCPDPDKCGGQWWEGGDKYLDYKAQEFKNASKEEALAFQDVEYIAAQNFTEKARKAAKESGFSVKWDEVKGDWIVHHKNGKQLVPTLTEFYISQFGNDGNMMAFMKAQSYLKRKDWVTQNLSNYNNNEMEANVGYLNTIYNGTVEDLNKDKKNADEKHELAENQSKNIDKYIEKNGYTDAQDWVTDWKAAKDQTAVTGEVKEVYKKAVDNANLTKYNKDNIKLYLDQMDNAMAMSMLKSYSKNAAEEYAYGTEEQTRDANPFAVQAKNHAFQAQQARERNGYTYTDPNTGEVKYVPGTDYYQKKAIKELEWQHDEEAKQSWIDKLIPGGGELKSDLEKSKFSALDIIDPDLAQKENNKKASESLKNAATSKRDLILSLVDAAILANQKEQQNAGSGSKLVDIKPFLNDVGLSGAAGNKYKVDYIKILKGDRSEYDKYVNILSTQSDILDRAYDASLKWGDPSTAIGALAYDNGWTKDAQDKFRTYKNSAKKNDDDYQWILNHNKIGTDKAKKFLQAEMGWEKGSTQGDAALKMLDKTIDPSTNLVINTPTKVIESVLLNNIAAKSKGAQSRKDFKISPTDYKLKMVHDAALDWADKNQNLFQAKTFAKAKAPTSPLAAKGSPQLSNEMEYISPYQQAYSYAVKTFADTKSKWDETYRENASAWNGSAGKGNSKFTEASSGTVDAIGGTKAQSNKTLFQLNDNYTRLKDSPGDLVITTGTDFSKERLEKGLEKGNKDWLVQVYEAYMNDMYKEPEFNKSGKPKLDDKRARADFNWTRIAGEKGDFVGYRLDFAPQWLEANTSTDKKTRLIPNDAEKLAKLQDGIVIFMKKDKVQGEFMTKSEYTIDDARMAQDGHITIQNKSGTAKLTRNPAGYYEITTLLNVVNGNGQIETRGGTEAVDPSFDPSTFRKMFTGDGAASLDWLDYMNQHSLGEYAAKYGKKNPQEVLGQ